MLKNCTAPPSHPNLEIPERFLGYISKGDFQCYMASRGCVIGIDGYTIGCDVRPYIENEFCSPGIIPASARAAGRPAPPGRPTRVGLGVALADIRLRSHQDKTEYRLKLLEYILHAPQLLMKHVRVIGCVHINEAKAKDILDRHRGL